MPRHPRLQYPGAFHHVMNRGASRQAVFLDPNDRLNFLLLVEQCTRRFGVEVHAYCLMGDHYHLLVRTPDEPNLDKAMQHLAGQYTRQFNNRHGRDGALFRGRYHSIVVEDDEYLVAASRYIHRNPLSIEGERITTYPWSSYPAYRGDRVAEPWLSTAFTLEICGGVDRYLALVESGLRNEVDDLLDRRRPPRRLPDVA